MRTTDFMSERDKQDLRDAGRGHLLGEYRSPLDVADEARKRSKEEPHVNTDKAEITGKPVEASNNSGVTSGVREDLRQGADGRSMDEAMTGVENPVQNEGDGNDIEAENADDASETVDPFEE